MGAVQISSALTRPLRRGFRTSLELGVGVSDLDNGEAANSALVALRLRFDRALSSASTYGLQAELLLPVVEGGAAVVSTYVHLMYLALLDGHLHLAGGLGPAWSSFGGFGLGATAGMSVVPSKLPLSLDLKYQQFVDPNESDLHSYTLGVGFSF